MVVPRTKYLIYSVENQGWWRANSFGYTEHKSEAGRFDYEEAAQIVRNANMFCDKNNPKEVIYIDK